MKEQISTILNGTNAAKAASKLASGLRGKLGTMVDDVAKKSKLGTMVNKVSSINGIEDSSITDSEYIEDSSITDSEYTENSTSDSENISVEDGNKMVQMMDWAFDKANGNIPGFGSSADTAKSYLEKANGNVSDAVSKIIGWQTTSAATASFVTGLGGLPTMLISLPANIAGVMAIQLRMIGSIAILGKKNVNEEDTKTGMYLCLLGTEAGSTLSKTAGQFAVKFATASLKKLPGEVLTRINQAVGFRLITKFGSKGLININKAIPILGGVVSGAVDAFSTYGIAQAAKALFLGDIIDSEKKDKVEIERVRLILNMAIIDGKYSQEEVNMMKLIITELQISDKVRSILYKEAESPRSHKIDYSYFKEDNVLAYSTLAGLARLAAADGVIHPAERAYIKMVGREFGLEDDIVESYLL